MENQNISYRRLRDPNRAKTCKFSDTLLAKKGGHYFKHTKQPKKKQFSKMSQNVTRYQHMLKNPHIKENYIDWIVKLREPIKIPEKSLEQPEFSVPMVFNKSTESRQNYLKAKNVSSVRSFNSADFYQALSRKQCNKHLQQKTLGYMTSLRESQKQINKTQKPKFCNIPFKDRNSFPVFITKQAIKHTNNLTKSELQSAFDGTQNFPPYTHKIVRQKNYGILNTFSNGPRKTSLPTLAWQMGLRN